MEITGKATLIVAVCALFTPATAWSASPRLYLDVRGIQEPSGTKPSLKASARALLKAELEKSDKVVTQLGNPAPKGEELEKALKAKGLTGYAVVLRITKVNHSMNPPAPGKVYKILMVEVAVAIDAEKIPSGQMALAGQGSAQVGTEVSRYKEKERNQLVQEALLEATRAAVQKSIAKLTVGAGNRKGKRGRKRRSRRKGAR
jgi:hypothetical protein